MPRTAAIDPPTFTVKMPHGNPSTGLIRNDRGRGQLLQTLYREEFVPMARITAPQDRAAAFGPVHDFQVTFYPAGDRPVAHSPKGTSLTCLYEGRGLADPGCTPFKNAQFKYSTIGLNIQWPGYEHFPYEAELAIIEKDTYMTRVGMGYHIAISFMDYIAQIEQQSVECRHPQADRWRLGGTHGFKADDISLVYLRNVVANIWSPCFRLRRPM